MLARLKPPHGFFNPGGFDYEGWLFQQGIDASGYVRPQKDDPAWPIRRLRAAPPFSIDALREAISQRLSQWLTALSAALMDSPVAPWLAPVGGLAPALAVGERQHIGAAQWQTLLATGTNHLMAISGLHIGLAWLFGFLLGRGLYARLAPLRWLHHLPAVHAGVLCGLLTATAYALLSGFAIPAQRALLMLATFAGASLLRRHLLPRDGLGLALLLVLLFDPLAVMSVGFWFSFIAVGVIFMAVQSLPESPQPSRWRRWLARLKLWLRLQLVLSLALLPLSLYLFQQASLIAPLANLLLVPWVSFLVAPPLLAALVLMPLAPALAKLAVWLAALLLALVWPLLQAMAGLPFARLQAALPWWGLLPAALLTVLLLAHRYPPVQSMIARAGRILRLSPTRARLLMGGLAAMLVVAALYFPGRFLPARPGAFRLAVLDVGQGLAVVAHTAHHTLVFDTGARLGDRLDAGRAVVTPYLRAMGVRRLDMLVISHADGDHIGGADSVLAAFPEARRVGHGLARLAGHETHPGAPCVAGMHWRWDGVDFRFLNPPEILPPRPPANTMTAAAHQRKAARRRNNASCVLRIASPAGVALLTGDIEKAAEARLLARHADSPGNELAADILLAPHHGSRTSSSEAFVQAVDPAVVVIPAGYRNRYHHPAPQVLARYRAHGARVWMTGLQGAVLLTPEPGGDSVAVSTWRQTQARYWNAPALPPGGSGKISE